MADNGGTLQEIEERLRDAFEEHARAQTRGEFYENVFAVHGGLEQALDLLLGDKATGLTFPQKFDALLPDVGKICSVPRVNWQRNELGHPKKPSDLFVYEAAVGIVELAAQAWPGLFGHRAPPVIHPPFSSQPAALLLPAAIPPAPYGPARQVQAVAMPAAPVTITPATSPAPGARTRWRLSVFGLLIVLALVFGAFLLGRDKGPADPTRIGVGGQVLVAAPKGNVVLSKMAPGLSQKQAGIFKNGSVLDVTAGPVAYEGLTWWKVRGPSGEGWTAADYLVPMER